MSTKTYEVVTRLETSEGIVQPGATVELPEGAARELLGCGAIRLLPGAAKANVKAHAEGGAPDKTLDDLTVPQLEELAAREQIDLTGAKGKPDKIARIAAVRLVRTARAQLTALEPATLRTAAPGLKVEIVDGTADADLAALIEPALAQPTE